MKKRRHTEYTCSNCDGFTSKKKPQYRWRTLIKGSIYKCRKCGHIKAHGVNLVATPVDIAKQNLAKRVYQYTIGQKVKQILGFK